MSQKRSRKYEPISVPEKKFFDTSVDDATVSAAMTINNLTIVAEGNGDSDRQGRQISVTDIHVKGALTLPAAGGASSSTDQVTCMLVQDKQTNGAAFTALLLIETDTFDAFRNIANSARFRVLWKEVYSMKAGGAAPSGAALVFSEDIAQIDANIKVRIPIIYNDAFADGRIATVRTNNLYWVTQASTGVCGIVATARIRYTDN